MGCGEWTCPECGATNDPGEKCDCGEGPDAGRRAGDDRIRKQQPCNGNG